MTDTPWTPGPWETAATADDLIVKGRVKIASTYPVEGDVWGAANARLIAAAPDMAEALETARETILHLIHMRGSEAEGTDADWVAEIDAALAKAKGATT